MISFFLLLVEYRKTKRNQTCRQQKELLLGLTWAPPTPVWGCFSMEKWRSSPMIRETEQHPAMSPSQTLRDSLEMQLKTRWPWTPTTPCLTPRGWSAESLMTQLCSLTWSTGLSKSSVMEGSRKFKLNTKVNTRHLTLKRFPLWSWWRWRRLLRLIWGRRWQMQLSQFLPISMTPRGKRLKTLE